MKQKIPTTVLLCLMWTIGWAQEQPIDSTNEASKDSPNETTNETVPLGAEELAQIRQPAADSTHVKVIIQKNQTIEEYRQRGELVLVKVIPNDGKPYFIDPLEGENMKGSGKDLLNSGVKPVRWVIKEF